MKINVEFDLTPDEFRRALGLPDVEAFQQELLGRIQKQMESGVEGYDPMSLMQPFLQQPMLQQGLSQGLASFGNYQQMMLDMLSRAAAGTSSGQGGKAAGANAEEAPARGAGSASATSARSRSRRDG